MDFPENYWLLLDYPDNKRAMQGKREMGILDSDYLLLKPIDSMFVGIKTQNGKFVCVDRAINSVAANRDYIGDWETLFMTERPGDIVTFQSSEKKYLGVNDQSRIVAESILPKIAGVFRKVKLSQGKFALKAYDGTYVSLEDDLTKGLIIGAVNIGPNESFELVKK